MWFWVSLVLLSMLILIQPSLASEGTFYSPHHGLKSLNLAKKASNLGQTTVFGIKSHDHAILVSTSFVSDKYEDSVTQDCQGEVHTIPCKKIVSFDECNFALASIGIISDSNFLLGKLFSEVTNHQYLYDTRLKFPRVCKLISELKYERTLTASKRPLGIEEVLIGLDVHGNATLIHVDTFGNIFHCETCCVGYESQYLVKELKILEKEKENQSKSRLLINIFDVLNLFLPTQTNTEIVVLDGLRKRLYSITGNQLQKFMEYSKEIDAEDKMEQYFSQRF